MKKIYLCLLVAIIICLPKQLQAVKAYPFPIETEQPNGEKITIQLHGDEFFHYTTTNEGYIIDIDNEGYFTFAEISDEGYIKPGKTRVSEHTLKSSDQAFLKSNSPEFIEKIKRPALLRKSQLFENVISPLRSSNLKSLKSSPVNGKNLVILVEFADLPFSVKNPAQSFSDMLNQTNYSNNGGTGSVRDYFKSSSDEKYNPQFDVWGPVKLSRNYAHYGQNAVNGIDELNVGQMILEACNTLKNNHGNAINFQNYDLDKKNGVDNVSVIYAGHNEAEGGGDNTIWPHQYYLKNYGIPEYQRTIDGVVIDSYMCTSELKGASGTYMASIGTFTHEYGHVLGLPDFYDANGEDDGEVVNEPTFWDIMSAGNYLNGGNTPPSYSAIERWLLEWMELLILNPNGNTYSLSISPITSSSNQRAFVVKTPTDGEFFTLEVRKKEGWDSYLPGEGLLIYHIDRNSKKVYQTVYGNGTMWDLWEMLGIPNIIKDHPGMKLIAANKEIMPYNNYEGHTFPGSNNVTSISDSTDPGFLSWNNEKSNLSISNIKKNNDGSVSFIYTTANGAGIKTYSAGSPFAFSDGNIVYLENITEKVLMDIYDIKGNKHISKNITEPGSQEIAVSGIYIIKLQTDKDVFIYKVIIK